MAKYESGIKQVPYSQEIVYAKLSDLTNLAALKDKMNNPDAAIIEREEPKLVKFASEKSPIPITLWIQLLPTSADSCKMRVTLEAELNFMFKAMIGGKLKDGVDKFADMLASIPYGK